ncbi:MAG: ABC transporter ATP-binding protein [Acidobacteriota bacterium]
MNKEEIGLQWDKPIKSKTSKPASSSTINSKILPFLGWRKKLGYVVGEHKARFVSCLCLGLLLNAFISATNPLALKYLFDQGIIRQNFKLFTILGLAFVILFAVWRVATLIYGLCVQKLKTNILTALSLRLVRSYYKIPYKEIINHENGYFISRVYDEIYVNTLPIVDSFFALLNAIISLLVALLVVSYISWRATIVLLVATPVLYKLSRYFGAKIKEESKQEQEEEARLRGVLGRALAAYKLTRVFQLQEVVLSKTAMHLSYFIDALYSRYKTSAIYQTAGNLLISFIETAAIISAGYEMLNGRMTFGGFMGFTNAFWIVIGSSREIFDLIPAFSRTSAAIERLMEFENRVAPLTAVHHTNFLHLEKISFSYNGTSILKDFNLSVEQKSRVLIVGPNGCGKSTLAHLAAGFLPPTNGEIYTFELNSISAVILPYDFIPGTVKDNVAFAAHPLQINRFSALAQEFGLADQLDKDPDEFSAGQKRKLAVMMGLLKEAELYIFDEPLASIDVESKEKVMNAIFRETKGKTLIVVMHGDEQYYHRFDQIVLLNAASNIAP